MFAQVTSTVSLALLGFGAGYLAATFSESMLHRYVGHGTARSRRRCRVLPVFRRFIETLHFGHAVVHHKRTFRNNHVTQFVDQREQDRLDEDLLACGQGEFIRLRYGLMTDLIGTVYFATPPLLLCAIASYSLTGTLTATFLISATIPISWAPLLSRYVHPFLHRPARDAREEAGPVTAWLLSTPYGRWARTTHYVHHRHPLYNFNLLPGGDYLLGVYRAPSESELHDMRAIGLLEDSEASFVSKHT